MHRFIPSLVIAALAVSLALKSARYLKSVPIEQDISIRHDIARFLVPFGWIAINPSEMSGHTVFQTFRFAKKTCNDPITIAVLGNNIELENFARISMGGDVGLFQNNQFVKNQNTLEQQIADARVQIGALFGIGERHIMPVIAISPMPPDAQHACAPPAKKYWHNLPTYRVH